MSNLAIFEVLFQCLYGTLLLCQNNYDRNVLTIVENPELTKFSGTDFFVRKVYFRSILNAWRSLFHIKSLHKTITRNVLYILMSRPLCRAGAETYDNYMVMLLIPSRGKAFSFYFSKRKLNAAFSFATLSCKLDKDEDLNSFIYIIQRHN